MPEFRMNKHTNKKTNCKALGIIQETEFIWRIMDIKKHCHGNKSTRVLGHEI